MSVTPQWLRHTFVSWCVNDLSIPLPIVQKLAGHRNIETTMGYVHVKTLDVLNALDDAIEDIDRGAEVKAWLQASPEPVVL